LNKQLTPLLIYNSYNLILIKQISLKLDKINNSDEYAEITVNILLELCSTCLDSFTDFDDLFGHEFSNELNKLDNSKIIQKMILENEKAQKIMNYLLDPYLIYK